MTNLTEKELSILNDSLSEEELLVKKYNMLAEHATDDETKAKMQQIASRHQSHFDELYQLL